MASLYSIEAKMCILVELPVFKQRVKKRLGKGQPKLYNACHGGTKRQMADVETYSDIKLAIKFLSWYFGDEPSGLIGLMWQRPARDEERRKEKKYDIDWTSYSNPEKINTERWRKESDKWGITFCTSLLRSREEKHNHTNCLDVSHLWFDVDACKKLGISGSEVYSELRRTEDVSCWTRSSENGIQGFFTLKEPYTIDGNKQVFEEAIEGLLWDICYYYGGDTQVNNLGRMMRLPGTLNIKPEYPEPWEVTCKIFEDNVYTLKELKERFKPNPDLVPRVVFMALCHALVDIWRPSERHELLLRLAGSVRKGGLNKDACTQLFREIRVFFQDDAGDDADRAAIIESTYSNNIEEMASIRTDYPEIADDVEKAINFWCDLKKKYCKERGFSFIPENVNLLQPRTEGNGTFFETEDMETMFYGKEGDEQFSNFVIRPISRVLKADSKDVVWRALMLTKNEVPATIEIPTSKTISWHQFASIKGVPIGASVLQSSMWNQYIKYLADNPPEITMKETPFYGLLGLETKNPTIMLQNNPHSDYVLSINSEDTAIPNAFEKELTDTEIKNYLETFLDSYKRYHEDRFIWPALGWFTTCSVSEIIRKENGFPSMMVYGLAESGKSHLITRVLSMHYGCERSHAYGSTTSFAMRKYLSGNNICPLVVDEFRDNSKERTKEIQGIIRSLWDGSKSSSGTITGDLRKSEYVAPLCLIGEHNYFDDEAAVHRSFSVKLSRDWLRSVRKNQELAQEGNTEAQARLDALNEAREWLHDTKYRGWLGTIIMSWVRTHLNEVAAIIQHCRKIVDDTSTVRIERKRAGFASVLTGYVILDQILAQYGLKMPIKLKYMLECIYTADYGIQEQSEYDTGTMQLLFNYTDRIILKGLRQKSPFLGQVYRFDSLDESIIYMESSRWFAEIQSEIHVASSASLTNFVQFKELLKEHKRNDDSPIIGFPKNDPYFPVNCVKIDLEKVRKVFHINTMQWKSRQEDID